MNMKRSTTSNAFKKAVVLITVQLFLLSNIGFAADDFAKATSPEIASSALAVDTLAIPRGIGTIKERSCGENGKLILYIQDAHCNYEAQNNISRILEHLIKTYNVNFVAVEGADGIVDTSWFKAFPDEDIKKEVADYFMKKGEITGAEFLSITSDYPFTIYGAEDRKSYIDNLNSFLESYPYKEEFLKYYTNIKSALAKLKNYIYTKELRQLDNQAIRHKDKKIKFADYARYLSSVAGKNGVEVKNYANFNILMEALKFEKNIDFDIVNEERALLIDELSKKISKEKLSELVNQSLSFKLGKLEGNEFYNYLADLAKENDILISKKYENLGKYMIYARIYARIDNELLFDEIDELIAATKEKMFQNDDQRVLNNLWKDVNTTLGFMNIELTNKEYEYYLGNKDKFSPEIFTSFINAQSSRFGLAVNIGVPSEELSSVFTKLIDFYEIALERDEILVKNMFKGMRGKKTDVAVLITGGFHTKGVTKFLKEKDASYVVISPSITEDTESPYIAVLTGQKTPFEELIIGGAEAAHLQFTSRFCRMCKDKNVVTHDIVQAQEAFSEEAARALMASHIRSFLHKNTKGKGFYTDKDPKDIKELVLALYKKCSRKCPARNFITDYIDTRFDEIYNQMITDGAVRLYPGYVERARFEKRDFGSVKEHIEELTPDVKLQVKIEGNHVSFDYGSHTEPQLSKEEENMLMESVKSWIATIAHAPPKEIPIFVSYNLDAIADYKDGRIEINRALFTVPSNEEAYDRQLFLNSVMFHEGYHFLNPEQSEPMLEEVMLEYFNANPLVLDATIKILQPDNLNLIQADYRYLDILNRLRYYSEQLKNDEKLQDMLQNQELLPISADLIDQKLITHVCEILGEIGESEAAIKFKELCEANLVRGPPVDLSPDGTALFDKLLGVAVANRANKFVICLNITLLQEKSRQLLPTLVRLSIEASLLTEKYSPIVARMKAKEAQLKYLEYCYKPKVMAGRINNFMGDKRDEIMGQMRSEEIKNTINSFIDALNARGTLELIDRLQVSMTEKVEKNADNDLAVEALLNGNFCLQMPFAGAGTRMQNSLRKFFGINESDSLEGFGFDEKSLKLANLDVWQIAAAMGHKVYQDAKANGKTDAEAEQAVLDNGLIRDIPKGHINRYGFGERAMLALEQGITNLGARDERCPLGKGHGLAPKQVQSIRDRMKIIVSVSKDIEDEVKRIFTSPSGISNKRFFGFKPENIVFVKGGYGPSFEFGDNKIIVPNEKRDGTSWNHGFAFLELAWLKGEKAYILREHETEEGKYEMEYLHVPVFRYIQSRGAKYSCVHRINDLMLLHPTMALDVQMLGAFLNLKKGRGINACFEMMANPTGQKGGLALSIDVSGGRLILVEGLAAKDERIQNMLQKFTNQEKQKTSGKRGVPYNRLYGYYDIAALQDAMLNEEMPLLVSQEKKAIGLFSPEIPTGDITWLKGVMALALVRGNDLFLDPDPFYTNLETTEIKPILPNEQRDGSNNAIVDSDGKPKIAYTRGEGAIIHDCKEAMYIKDALRLVEYLDRSYAWMNRKGGAITVNGEALTPEQKVEVDSKIRHDFETGIARLVDALDDVEIYEIPSLRDCPYLIAHPGRGGEVMNHSKRRIYMSPERVAWYRGLSDDARRQFLAHEIQGYLNHPDWAEDQTRDAYPINLVLAESVMELSREESLMLNQAKEKIGGYLKAQYDNGMITKDIYDQAVENTYMNLEAWVTDANINRISPNTRGVIFDAIKQGKWADLVEVFRQDITFGTAGIRGKAALSKRDLEILNEEGPLAPILKGPNTINDIVLLLKTEGVIKYAKKHGLHKVAIGYDSRIHGKAFAEMIAQSFIGSSTDEHQFIVYLFDAPSPFPELSFGLTTREVRADLGILISASHNPSNYNGYKITDYTGAQLSGDMRNGIVQDISTITPSDIKLKGLEEAKEGQLIWLGGKEPIAGYDYKGVDVQNPEYFIDMHTLHVEQVKKFIVDRRTLRDNAPKVNVGFSAFNGAGNLAVPRLLGELGFTNVRVVSSLQELNGMFPAFGWGEQPDPGDSISADIAVEEFIEEHGQQAFDELDILIGTDPDADRAGIIIKVPESQQHLYGEYKLLSANDAWTLLIWYRLNRARELNNGVLPEAKRKYITFSHVTTDALERVGKLFGVRSLGEMLDSKMRIVENYLEGRRCWVGFTYIAAFCRKMSERHLINEGGAEESNGFSILGGDVRKGEVLAEGGHVNDKDGAFAAILLAEAACYAKSKGTTLFELLDNIYMNPEVGYFATANKPLPRVGSFEGAEGVSKKIKLLKTAQGWMEEANERRGTYNPFTIAGLPVIGAVEFKTGKYDKQHYEGFPDEGIRFFFADEELEAGEPFYHSKNYITIRPSGTSQTIRFYTQLFAGVNPENLAALKYKTARRAEALALQAQLELLNAAGYNQDMPNIDMIVKQLEDAGHVLGEVIPLIQGKELPTAKTVMENVRKYSGLPVSLQNVAEPETMGRPASEIWSEVFSRMAFDQDVFYRAERVGDSEERATGQTAFRSISEDTDIQALRTYPKTHHDGLVRSGEKMQQVLMDKQAQATPEAYFMYRGVFRSREHIQKAFYDNKQRYDITVIPPARWGEETSKTFGHYHDPVEKPEIYQVLSGEAIYFIQKCNESGEVVDAIMVKAKAGDIVIMLPGYGHVSINTSQTEPLVMANWLTWHQTSFYGSFQENRGAVYYATLDEMGNIVMKPNANYENIPPLRQMKPRDAIPAFGLVRGEPIYNLVESDRFAECVDFLNNPDKYKGELTPESTLLPEDSDEKVPVSGYASLMSMREAERAALPEGKRFIDETKEDKTQVLGIVDESRHEKVTLEMGASQAVEPFAEGRSQTLHVEAAAEEGVELVNKEGKVLDIVKPGEIKTVSVLYDYIHAPGPATVHVEYEPQGAEAFEMTIVQNLKPFAGLLQGAMIDFVCPQEGLKNGRLRKAQEFLNEKLGIDAKIIPFQASVGLSDVSETSFRKNALTVLLTTKDNFEKADCMLGDRNSIEYKLLSSAIKLPALENLEKFSQNDTFFLIEMLASGAAMAVTPVNDRGEVEAETMLILQDILVALTGKRLDPGSIYCFLSYDRVKATLEDMGQDLIGAVRLIQTILMSMPAKPETGKLRDRLEAKRKLDYSL